MWVSLVLQILRALGKSYSQLEARISANIIAVSGTAVASGSYSSGDYTAAVVTC